MKKLIVITTPDGLPNEEQLLTRLFEAGLECLHLRKPNSSREEMEQLIRLLPDSYYTRIVLHDHHELAMRYPLGGIHLNSRHPEAPAGYKGSISRSCHQLSEVKLFVPYCDYLFLSPIFPSISKEGYGSGFSMECLQQAANEGIINQQVIALGGMDRQRIRSLQAIPFGGYAVLGAVWGNHLPAEIIIQNFKSIKESL